MFTGASCTDTGSTRTHVELQLDAFYKVSTYNLNTNHFQLQNSGSVTEILSPAGSALTEQNCNETIPFLHIANGQSCRLLAQEYNYEYITIESGGEITLRGDAQGEDKTELTVDRLNIRPGGTFTGVGTGRKYTFTVL